MASNIDEIVTIVLESSDDDNDEDTEIARTQNNSSIRTHIEEAKRLLAQAEIQSRPSSEGQTEVLGLQRYRLSSQVTANDLLRNVEFAGISDVLSCLKARLSAERIFNIGLPESAEERDIFDDLLMRYSADLLSGSGYPQSQSDNGTSLSGANVHTNREDEEENGNNSLHRYPSRMDSTSDTSDTTQAHVSSVRLSQIDPINAVLDTVGSEIPGRNNSPTQVNSSIPPLPSTSTSTSSSSPHTSPSDIPPMKIIDSLIKLKEYLNSSVHENCGSVNKHVAAIRRTFQELNQSSADENSDSSTPSKRKRQRGEETPPSSSKKAKLNESDDEGETCSICFETWSSGGDHRICCLKCGHLFGLSCITKWIEQAKCCPHCKVPAKKTEIRSIYGRRLTVEDTSQRDRAMKMLEEERQAKRSLEHKEALARKNVDDLTSTNQTLKVRLARMESELSSCGRSAEASGASSSMATSETTVDFVPHNNSQPVSNKKYQPLSRVNISQEGSCRVFEYNSDLGMIIVSAKSSNPLFRGFGIKSLSRDFRIMSYQPLHSAAIRDMSFRPATFDGTLLSCGMDRVIQLTSVTSKCVIQKYTLNGSAWCCAWNTLDTNLFYVGMERGVVQEFDIRRTDSHIQEVVKLGGAPISSLHFWNGMDQESRSFQGLLIAHLRELMFKGKTEEGFSTHLLHNSNASITGLSLHPSGLFLVSNRPSAGNPMCRYEACQLNQSVSVSGDLDVKSPCVSSWDGGNVQVVMSRNALLSVPETDNHILAATANHSSNKVNLWDVTRRQHFQTVNSFDKALDIKSMRCGNQDLLGILSDSELVVYKWR